jgi:hypothetical protein
VRDAFRGDPVRSQGQDRAQRALTRGLREGSLDSAEFDQSVARVVALRGG